MKTGLLVAILLGVGVVIIENADEGTRQTISRTWNQIIFQITATDEERVVVDCMKYALASHKPAKCETPRVKELVAVEFFKAMAKSFELPPVHE
jgi:hypothetical protein